MWPLRTRPIMFSDLTCSSEAQIFTIVVILAYHLGLANTVVGNNNNWHSLIIYQVLNILHVL